MLHKPSFTCPFSFECKNQEGWELDGAFYAEQWEPWKWWGQCQEQARTVGRTPVLIFTRNRRPIYALMAEETGTCLSITPHHGPVVRLVRPDGARLWLVRLDDLVRVPRRRLRCLSRASGGGSSRRSRTTKPPPRGASGAPTAPQGRRKVAC